MTLLNTQSGRSMVEMLGVLAIIGVLSVGGIAGYKTAMDKHKTNELLNTISIERINLTNQVMNENTTLSLSNASSNAFNFATGYQGESTTAFYISASPISTEICKQIQNVSWDESTTLYDANDTQITGTTQCADDMTVKFVFQTSTSSEPEVNLCEGFVSAEPCFACDPKTGEQYRTDGRTSGPCKT